MEDLQIGIENDLGELVSYKIDKLLTEGLYLTIDLDKVIKNCENFNIKIDTPEKNMISTKLSKRDNISILTIKINDEKMMQYLIGNDLNTTEFEKLSEQEVPSLFKQSIIQGYNLSKTNKLSDIL